MAKSAKQKKIDKQVEEVSRKRVISDKDVMSGFKMKDEFFDKTKTFIDKDSKEVKEGAANWRNLHLGGKRVVCFEGKELTNSELSAFDNAAKEYYLEKVKSDYVQSEPVE